MKKQIFTLTTLALVLAGCDSSEQATKTPEPQKETMTEVAPQVAEPQADSLAELPPQVTESVTTESAPVVTSEADTAHNAANSLDWQGTYTGTIPCADCSGIQTSLTLNDDQTYTLNEVYKDKKDGNFSSTGKFTWDENGSVITLTSDSDTPRHFFVAENQLIMLDTEGKRIEGELEAQYHLKKQ